MTRIDAQITSLHRRLVELGATNFTIETSEWPNLVTIIVGDSVYSVDPDEAMDALDVLDNLDGTDSEEFVDEVWDTIAYCDL